MVSKLIPYTKIDPRCSFNPILGPSLFSMCAPPKIIAAIGTFFIINPALMPNCSIKCLVRSLASALRLFCSWRYKEVDVISNPFILRYANDLTTHNINDQIYQIAFDLSLLICQLIYPMSFRAGRVGLWHTSMVRRSKIFTTVIFSSLTFEYLGSFHDAQQYSISRLR